MLFEQHLIDMNRHMPDKALRELVKHQLDGGAAAGR